MDRDPQAPRSFDPDGSEAPLLPDAPPGGGLVLLVVASSPDRAWAERTAMALASAWAGRKRRILLADLALMGPGLHRVVGVENGEGMTDAFLFGSSILRVARPVRDRGFLFVPAGTATARPQAVAASPRWTSMLEACDRIGATLVVFLPSDLPGGEHLLDRATDVFLLAGAGAQGTASLQAGFGDRLRAVLTSPASNGASRAPTAAEDFAYMPGPGAEALAGLGLDLEFQAPEAEEEQAAAPSDDAPGSPPEPPSAAVPEWARAPADSAAEPEPAPRPIARATPTVLEPPPSSGGRNLALALGGVVVAAAVLAAGYFGLVSIPGVTPAAPAPEPAATPASAPQAAPEIASASGADAVLGVSLTLGQFTDPAVARLQASSLAEQRPDLLFVVAPVESAGTVYYRLLAGPAVDSAEAVALRDSLATTLTREDRSTWVIRDTPLAFNLGDRAELAEARARIADLASVDIPAYVLELPPRTVSGALRPRFRVYGGAFADEAEAAYFQSLLVAKGYPDARLTERQGRHPE